MFVVFCQGPDRYNDKKCRTVPILNKNTLANTIATYSQNITKEITLPDDLKIKKITNVADISAMTKKIILDFTFLLNILCFVVS